MNTLSEEDVIAIHQALAKDFSESNDPISPPGIKSTDLLSSAISRQFTGYSGNLKYETPYLNSSSLAYGICCNHPFHNGNKRTALVVMLCHLDKNNITFKESVKHDELYKFMINVASHGFCKKRSIHDKSDEEISEMAKWVRNRTRKIEKGERVITYRELESILKKHGFSIENICDNYADIIRHETKRRYLGLLQDTRKIRVLKIPYPGGGKVVGKNIIRDVRQKCQLTDNDGIDSSIFYKPERPVDEFIKKYRNLLKRLAKT